MGRRDTGRRKAYFSANNLKLQGSCVENDLQRQAILLVLTILGLNHPEVWQHVCIYILRVCVCIYTHGCMNIRANIWYSPIRNDTTGWLRLVGSSKVQVSFAKQLYKRDYILQKGPIFLRSPVPHGLLFGTIIRKSRGKVIQPHLFVRHVTHVWHTLKESCHTHVAHTKRVMSHTCGTH